MTFRVRIEQWLHTFFEVKYNVNLTNYGLHDVEELGPIKLNGAPDVIYGGLVLDYKAVGQLTDKTNRDAITGEFREKYLDPIPESMRVFFKGIIFDGKKIVFMEWSKERWLDSVEDFTEKSLRKWLEWLIKVIGKNPSSGLLSKTFSINKSYTRTFISTLYQKLKEELEKGNTTVSSHFDQWHDMFIFLYGTVLSGEKIKGDFSEVARKIIKGQRTEIPFFLFTLFTYYAKIIALICAEILCASWQQPSISKAILSSGNMRSELEHLLRGDFFKKNFKLGNFVDDLHNFFWFFEVWDESIEEAVRPILERVSEFNFLLLAGLTARDVLKGLYEEIVPSQIRHDLGEVFTPDWLVNLALNEVGYEGDIDRKILDPGCGRGVFLAEAITKTIKKNSGVLSDEQLFQRILNNIIGFDINPIAVLTARTNYIIALSPLLSTLREVSNPVTIPIFMTDSILTPTIEDVTPGDVATYKISTTSGIVRLRKSLVEKENLPKTTKLLKTLSQFERTNEAMIRKLVIDGFPPASDDQIKDFLEFYNSLAKLDKYEYNTIVSRMQSFLAPLEYLQSFDFVVGNPPWIKWEFLAKEYKKKLGVLYLKVYKLFSHGGMRAGMGYAHDDISIVFTYVALDKYLKLGGKFAFLLKQTLYKSIAGKEFRKFYIDKVTGKVPLRVQRVHDLVDIHPFQPIQSETSLIIMEKGKQTTYPVPYLVWKMKDNKSPSEVSSDYSLPKVLKLVNVTEYEAYPDPSLRDDTAPWIVVPKGAELPIPTTIISNPYDVRHGIVDDLDQVFQVEILEKTSVGLLRIKNAISGKRDVKQVIWEIEPDLIYPLIKPRNIKRWKVVGYDYVILPQRTYGENNEAELKNKYPRTYTYLSMFRRELLQRTSRWFKNRPFYTVFGLGEYTFKPYKVVWSAIGYPPEFAVSSIVEDVFLGKKVLIPDNTIGSIPVDSEDETHFLCALLNSSYIKSVIAHKSTKSKWGLSIELVKQLPLPRFDPRDDQHEILSSLAKKARRLANGADKDELSKAENEINVLSEKIITKAQRIFAKSKLDSWA